MSVSGLAINIDGQSAWPIVTPNASVAGATSSAFRPHMSWWWCFRESTFYGWDVGFSAGNSLIGETCATIGGAGHGGRTFGNYCRRP